MKPVKALLPKFCLLLCLGSMAVTSGAAWSTELAKVNGHAITDKDLRAALSGLNEGQAESVLRDINTRRQILSGLIDQELLALEAEKEKLDQETDFKTALDNFRKQFLVNRVLQKTLTAKLNDATAKKFFEAHKTKYSSDSVHVQHILLADESAAREMLKKAKDSKSDFQELAEKNSKDPSAKNNRGDVGVIMHDSPFVDEFKNAAFAAKKGDIIGPVKTMYGYHIIKIIDRKTGKTMTYDEAEVKVKNDLKQELVHDYVTDLKKEAKVQIDDKALEKM